MLTDAVKNYIDKAVLCWLATSNSRNEPNVSPKEMFTYAGDDKLIIAHLASPVSVSNIRTNPNVCVSFVDVFVQKGYKIKGTARLIYKADAEFAAKVKLLFERFTDQFPVQAVIEVDIKTIDTILAPSYFMVEGTTEQSQVESAMATYGVQPANRERNG